MATQVKHRRGTNAEILAGTPAIGELWFNTTDNSIHMGDGVTQGGLKFSKDLSGSLFGNDGKEYKVISGVIRNTGSGWQYIDDSGHSPVGFNGISTNVDGTITLNHDVGGSKVVSLLAVPDETYTQYGLVCGASVGVDLSILALSTPLSFYVNMDTQVVTAPAHFGDSITAILESGAVKLNYPTLLSGETLISSRLGSSVKPDIELSMEIGTGVAFCRFSTDIYGYISYSGTGWSVLGSNAPGTLTPVWDGVSALDVSHPSAGSLLGVSIDGRWPMHAMPDSVGSSSVKVRFVDLAGNSQTSENSNMRFFLKRAGVNPIDAGVVKVPLGTWGFNGPHVKIDANDLSNASGNIWLIGLIEK